MINEDVKSFLSSANHYCTMIDSLHGFNEKSLDELLAALLELYIKALRLPEVEPDHAEAPQFEISFPKADFAKYEYYWEVFDPYKLEEPVCGSLSDDILDIYKDLKEGIILFEQNTPNEAIWHLKFSFQTHWGLHAVNALRALHAVKGDIKEEC
ncbi:DUF5063 domain-containing protein [Metabacillus sp. GX 13764]|uniref:DUF5063 domain-containing protein n=1 Tax=Metabacillus kandeliae TaxID=2900151 RepID=UPI001E3873F7|nr:DUF5063 domain-containing protein [Metabacillus kandeliae]MCD7036507.1 DUF5063 domain-containing protein [Metabacillus kandeliae]